MKAPERQGIGNHNFRTGQQPTLTTNQKFRGGRWMTAAQVFEKALGAVNGSGGQGGEENEIGDIFTQGDGRQTPRLTISQGGDEAEGDIGEAQPTNINGAGTLHRLPRQGAEQGAEGLCDLRNFKG